MTALPAAASLRWLRRFLLAALLLAALAAGFNMLVDPWGLWGAPYLPGFNAIKNRIPVLEDRRKLLWAAGRGIRTAVLGTSRASMMDTRVLADYLPGPVYNFALTATSISELGSYLEAVFAQHPIADVVLAPDFYAFNPLRNVGSYGQEFRNPAWLRGEWAANDVRRLLFTQDALLRSLGTVWDNVTGAAPENWLEAGIFSYNQVHALRTGLAAHGPAYMESRFRVTLQSYALNPALYNNREFSRPESLERGLQTFRRILALCRARGVRVHLFLPPISARQFDLIHRLGLGETFAGLKKALAAELPLYDFTSPNDFTRDLNNFVDSNHLRLENSQLVFRWMFGGAAQRAALPEDFGVLLTAGNVAERVAKQQALVQPFDLEALFADNRRMLRTLYVVGGGKPGAK